MTISIPEPLGAGATGALVASAVYLDPIIAGGNGGALALLAAWAVPDLEAARAGSNGPMIVSSPYRPGFACQATQTAQLAATRAIVAYGREPALYSRARRNLPGPALDGDGLGSRGRSRRRARVRPRGDLLRALSRGSFGARRRSR